MQETETTQAAEETILAPEARPDLDMSQFIPDDIQPFWDLLAGYPVLLTLLLVALAYVFGKLIKMVVYRSLMKVASKTTSKADDNLITQLTRPLVLTTVTLALMMVVSVYHLPKGLQDATLSVLATILLFSWLRVGLRAARIVLELVANNHHRFEIVQERTIPIFDMTIKMLLVGLGAYVFLMVWGINPTAWLASAGVIGIAVGFAAKDTLANLLSGIAIVADTPYKIGDYIVIDTGERGRVTNLGMRSTRLLTRDDVEVTVPNAVIANAKIINESGGPWVKHRIRVPVGVAYGSDVDEVCSILEEITANLPGIVNQPAPRVRMRALGNSSLDFELLAWIDHPELRGRVRHDLLMKIYKVFNEKGISIPYPQTDIHVRTLPDTDDLKN
ncbi:MAG: mechanosensitive ion channel family protein [Xanthomonadales bacterium]|nr:mechanosensitive ion channel family protein [Xanthomonadales bacterium]